MEAKITKAADVTVVALSGYMNFETTLPFRKTCFDSLLNKSLIFDLRALSFVGSSGLTSFVEVIREFRKTSGAPVKFCGMSNEFRRLFWASEMADIEVYEDQTLAHASFYQQIQPIQFAYAVEAELEIAEGSAGEVLVNAADLLPTSDSESNPA